MQIHAMPRYLLNIDKVENTANLNTNLDVHQNNASDYASLGPQMTVGSESRDQSSMEEIVSPTRSRALTCSAIKPTTAIAAREKLPLCNKSR